MSIATVHDPIFSRAQSALHHALVRRATAAGLAPTDAAAPSAELSSDHPAMQAMAALGHQFVQHRSLDTLPAGADSTLGLVAECAKLYAQYVEARVMGNHAVAQLLKNELTFSSCDPLWIEAITTYEEFVHSGNTIPYITLAPGTGVIPVGATLTVALIADWATGTTTAQNVLAQAVAMNPDIIVHLGDVYYSGTATEEQNYFYQAMADGLQAAGKTMGTGPGDVRVFTLAGNHDMYSGGAGYYSVIKQLGQPASYFCLQNDDWQIVCLDTGYNDRDPFTVVSNITQLTDDQVVWLNDLMAGCGSRSTLFLSHHQLYSGAGPVGQSAVGSNTVNWGINPSLFGQLQAILDRVAVWIWGHEHNTVVFNPHVGLPAGRCIGSGAIPMLVEQDPYTTDTTLQGIDGVSPIAVPTMDLTYKLGDNGTDFNHGFAMLSLSGATATVSYYEVPVGGGPAALLGPSETFPTS
jgi:predicted phosphodiesterase